MNHAYKKGAKRGQQMRRVKTEAMIFFVECLNDLSNLLKLQARLSIGELEDFKNHELVTSFLALPHDAADFHHAINSYRAKLILQLLGHNVNPAHLKSFSQSANAQNRKRCKPILMLVEAHSDQYREVLNLFVTCFVDELKQVWQQQDALLEAPVSKKSLTKAFDELLLAQLHSESDQVVSSSVIEKSGGQRVSLEVSAVKKPALVSDSERKLVASKSPVSTDSASVISSVASELPASSASPAVRQAESKSDTTVKTWVSDDGRSSSTIIEMSDSDMALEDKSKPKKALTIYEQAALAAEEDPELAALFDTSNWDF